MTHSFPARRHADSAPPDNDNLANRRSRRLVRRLQRPPERQPMTNDELIERLREHATDWKGDQMPGIEPAKGYPTAGTMSLVAARIKALSVLLAELDAAGGEHGGASCGEGVCQHEDIAEGAG